MLSSKNSKNRCLAHVRLTVSHDGSDQRVQNLPSVAVTPRVKKSVSPAIAGWLRTDFCSLFKGELPCVSLFFPC